MHDAGALAEQDAFGRGARISYYNCGCRLLEAGWEAEWAAGCLCDAFKTVQPS